MSSEHPSRLQTAREALGLSRDELALRAALSGEYVRRLERGLHTPTIEIARRLAAALGTTVDALWPPLPAAVGE